MTAHGNRETQLKKWKKKGKMYLQALTETIKKPR